MGVNINKPEDPVKRFRNDWNNPIIKGNPIILNSKLEKIIKVIKEKFYKIINKRLNIIGTGFFCQIPYKDSKSNYINVLITNNHILKEEDIKPNKKIELEKDGKTIYIIIDNNKFVYTNQILDTTIIEINNSNNNNNFNIDSYLLLDDKYNNKQYKNYYTDQQICMIQNSNGEECSFYPGIILDITGIDIIHNCCTNNLCSSGGAILLVSNCKLIGIQKFKESPINNKATYIKYPVNDFLLKYKYYNKNKHNKKDNINNNNSNVTILTYEDGIYEGNIINNSIKEGKGIFKYNSGNKYEGEWKNDKQSGIGIYYWNDGEIYNGEWSNGYMEGKGTFYYKNGDEYEGDFKHDKKEGKGIYYYTSGHKYNGEYVNDLAEGKGIFTYLNGNKYEGEFKNELMHGKGTFYYKNGNKYDGNWYKGFKQGKGILYYQNGEKYEGQFSNNVIEGKGVYYFTSKSRYEGDWIDGKMEGFGIYYYKNGDKYEGQWINGMKCGKGVYYYNVGDKYDGQWKDGLKDGDGIYYYKNGNIHKGKWKNDKKIQ